MKAKMVMVVVKKKHMCSPYGHRMLWGVDGGMVSGNGDGFEYDNGYGYNSEGREMEWRGGTDSDGTGKTNMGLHSTVFEQHGLLCRFLERP